MSSFQRFFCTQLYQSLAGTKDSVLIKEVSLFQRFPYEYRGVHCNIMDSLYKRRESIKHASVIKSITHIHE